MLRTVFPTGTESFVHGDYTSPIGSVHMMMEGFDFDCDQTMFDDIVIKRYTGSPEQAAAINSAVQPSDVLFAEDFESGSGGWHGKDANERPETAIVMEDPDGNHGFVMAMTDCVGGGDAFGKATFECSQENKCLVSYYIKGRAWQGFSESYPGNHIWTAAPDNNYPGVHLQTVHDTGNWHREIVMLSRFGSLRKRSLSKQHRHFRRGLRVPGGHGQLRPRRCQRHDRQRAHDVRGLRRGLHPDVRGRHQRHALLGLRGSRRRHQPPRQRQRRHPVHRAL